ncbi:TrmH family RNA methyltransferase [Teredinibacter waterburyi]|uniref:TrmH family RNA methyltransferase n=1 Tax=Teredinibacter waterburyi TaxID=1500538 RepID=UPI00165F5A41|nr:RNA methyltransferase [Teredinibacter waterburyi]
MNSDSPEYLKRKKFINQLLTIYGRNPCLEAMADKNVDVYRLHLADSNKSAKVLDELVKLAEQRGAEVLYHDKKALSRISKNGKQDQGVAVDLHLKQFIEYEDFLRQPQSDKIELIALDRITNPQNLGMILRSVCASPLKGLILPRNGCAKLDSLVIKASTGTLFRTNIIRCDNLDTCLESFAKQAYDIVGLNVNAQTSLKSYQPKQQAIYVLGNETEGLSDRIQQLCNRQVKIDMRNQVESLNVAVTASLIAFRNLL